MKIIRKDEEKVKFKDVPVGEVFSCYGSLYMSTKEVISVSTGELYNAVSLQRGDFSCFNADDEVRLEEVKLIVS